MRLLIVEDEPEMLLFLKRFFQRKGYSVTAVTRGEDAWTAMTETEYDLVISDLVLEKMSGMELLKKTRAIDKDLPLSSSRVPAALKVLFTPLKWERSITSPNRSSARSWKLPCNGPLNSA